MSITIHRSRGIVLGNERPAVAERKTRLAQWLTTLARIWRDDFVSVLRGTYLPSFEECEDDVSELKRCPDCGEMMLRCRCVGGEA